MSDTKIICSFDIDGVIYNGEFGGGIYPGPDDIIVTGRSIDEKSETIDMLHSRGIYNEVFFNPIPYVKKTRETSGIHKAKTLLTMPRVAIHYEDDPVQAEVIKYHHPNLHIILINNPLVTLSNRRHLNWREDG